jgi:hypothetical protein
LAAANKSDMDTVLRLPETTYDLAGLAPGGTTVAATPPATTTAAATPTAAAVAPKVPAPGTVTAASAVATPAKATSQKSQVASTGAGLAGGESYP